MKKPYVYLLCGLTAAALLSGCGNADDSKTAGAAAETADAANSGSDTGEGGSADEAKDGSQQPGNSEEEEWRDIEGYEGLY